MGWIEKADMIPLALVVGSFIGIYLGYDSNLLNLLALAGGFYFGHKAKK